MQPYHTMGQPMVNKYQNAKSDKGYGDAEIDANMLIVCGIPDKVLSGKISSQVPSFTDIHAQKPVNQAWGLDQNQSNLAESE